MSSIKIDEVRYFQFLVTVEEYLKKYPGDRDEHCVIQQFIDQERKLRELFIARKTYYDAYMAQKDKNTKFANEMYYNYQLAKKEIETMRGVNGESQERG